MTIILPHRAKSGDNYVENDTDQRPLDKQQQVFLVNNERFVAFAGAQTFHTSYRGPPSYVTAIGVEGQSSVTKDWLQQELANFRSTDDVFCIEFLSGVIFTRVAPGADLDITPDASKLLGSLGTNWIEVSNAKVTPPPGPYLTSGSQLLEVFKLYDDVQGAFITNLIPGTLFETQELHIGGNYVGTVSIAVPSRLRSTTDKKAPLAGLRIAVKDIFMIQGIRTSVCNRAYYELYPPAKETAGCIKILSQAGANIVGTTKLASFAATEEPIECIDFQAPWNPRADGHQSPAGSSSGSGVAVASYAWLDISIGSDTSGSGRRPGHWNGCYAMRPSHGVLPVDGYIESFRQFDVPTFFARDIRNCRTFAEQWYGKKLPNVESLPPAIIYPLDYMSLVTNRDQLEIIERFVEDLESTLGVKQKRISFGSLWETSPPSEARGQSLQEYMKDACRDSFFYDDYHSFDNFRKDFQQKFHKAPYVSPPVQWQWELAAKITRSERDTAVARLEVYRKWFCCEVMQVEKRSSIVVLPIENISPRYRDEATSRFCPIGVPMLFLSPIMGGPELTVPVGQTPFQSRVSGRIEHLPVAISLLASPGRDIGLLAQTQECLETAGRPISVRAGNVLFHS